MDSRDYNSLSISKVIEQLKSSRDGLSNKEAYKRIKEYGHNLITSKTERNSFFILFSQISNPLIVILIFAAGISYLMGSRIEPFVIISIIGINSILGFFQEYKAEKTIKELLKKIPTDVKAIRNSVLSKIDSHELVPGDVIKLNIGNSIPADCKIIEYEELVIDESMLSGESAPVLKDKNNSILFSGTYVKSGCADAIVINTGMSTEFGKIKKIIAQKEPETEFERGIRKFSGFILKFTVLITFFIFFVNSIRGIKLIDSFLFALALAVGITPEMLPMIITITMSKGARRMAKKKVIIKKLSSIEDIGNMNILCCDKTGTLTQGKFSLIDYVNISGEKDSRILLYSMLCNNSLNSIDKVIIDYKENSQIKREVESYKITDVNEFDFERKRMSSAVRNNKEKILISKGSVESILEISKYIKDSGKTKKIEKKTINSIKNKAESYEKQGYSIIALAYRRFNKKESVPFDEKDMIFYGFLLFLDPPKSCAKKSLAVFKKLGVDIKIISGDSPFVVEKISRDVGIEIKDNKVITGAEIEKMDANTLCECCKKYNVFARINPKQKYEIVSCIKNNENVLGYLGDGINDAPALKAVDVGISVDSAVNIARESADIILTEKSLKVISDGIIEGRKTFGNVMKYIFNTTSANSGNMLTLSLSSLFMNFIPLLPSQILLNNFLSDIPLLNTATDNVDEEFLNTPKKWNIKLISRFLLFFGFISSFYDILFIAPLLFFKTAPGIFRTAWFVESCLSEIAVTFSIRTRKTFYRSAPSFMLSISSIFVSFFVLLLPYLKAGEALFQFSALSVNIVGYIFLIISLYFITVEIVKKYFFKAEDKRELPGNY